MKHKKDHIVFDFKKLTERGTKKIISSFKKNGLDVVQVEEPKKITRINGIATKKIRYIFDNGQSSSFFVNKEGDPFRVTMNNTIIPIKNTTSLARAVKEIANKIKLNSANFQKSLARKLKLKEESGGDSASDTAKKMKGGGMNITKRVDTKKAMVNDLRFKTEEQLLKAFKGNFDKKERKLIKEIVLSGGIGERIERIVDKNPKYKKIFAKDDDMGVSLIGYFNKGVPKGDRIKNGSSSNK